MKYVTVYILDSNRGDLQTIAPEMTVRVPGSSDLLRMASLIETLDALLEMVLPALSVEDVCYRIQAE